MRVLVTGDRHFKDVPFVWRTLDCVATRWPAIGITWLIDGASDDVTGPYVGVDYWAHQWARSRGIATIRQSAKWKEHGRAAGPIRNGEMIALHKPDALVAFPGNRGTANMVSQAKKAGLLTIEAVPFMEAFGTFSASDVIPPAA
jgi:hypothetical protein